MIFRNWNNFVIAYVDGLPIIDGFAWLEDWDKRAPHSFVKQLRQLRHTSMNLINTPQFLPFTRKITLIVAAATLFLTGQFANAHPYASGITGTNGAGNVSFIMNEAGAAVDVVFEDGTTKSYGGSPKVQRISILAPHKFPNHLLQTR